MNESLYTQRTNRTPTAGRYVSTNITLSERQTERNIGTLNKELSWWRHHVATLNSLQGKKATFGSIIFVALSIP